MKQLLQNIHNGETEVVDVPMCHVSPEWHWCAPKASLSRGDRAHVGEFAEKSLVGKALSRPDLVRQIVDKARREGVLSTVQAASTA
jgi:hypothetical protein